MQTTSGAFHPTRFGDLAVTVDFHCQSACRFCIVREGMNHYRGVPLDRFRELAEDNRSSGKYERVIFTGGEVTLEASLFDFVRVAREVGGFSHVQLQTNGRRLADEAYARALAEAGVDELLLSLHGPDAAVQDWISQRQGSFDEAVRGIENARALGISVCSNTVMNRDNVASLPAMPDRLRELGVQAMELWNYLPMEDTEEARRLIAPLSELMPALRACLARCEALEMPVVTKYVPRCMLGPFGDTLDNSQADVMIVESFWDEFPAFSCLYEAVCEHSDRCLGLHHPYVHEHGWEEDRLTPEPRTSPWNEREHAPAWSTSGLSGPWAELVAGVPPDTPGWLERAWLTRNEARYRFGFEGGGSVEVVVAPRDDERPALARSRSFNVFYTGVDAREREAEVRARVTATVRSIVARDDGTLHLDAAKGLDRAHVRRRRLPTAR